MHHRISKKETPQIVYVSPYYQKDSASGANRRFDELCKRFLTEFGDNFTLIVSRGNTPDWWNGSNLIVVEYEFNHKSKFKAAKQIAKVLDTLPPSIVVVESIPIPFRALKRHVHFQVAYDFRYFTGDSKSFLYRLIFSPYLKYQWRNSQFMVTCSEFSIAELEKYVGYRKERVIKSFFGMDQGLFAVAEKTAPEKNIDVIYVAHFEKRKNHAPLIEALTKVAKDLRVVFHGRDNGMMTELEAQAKRLGLTNTTFGTQSIPDEELWDMYRRSRVFAYPSTYEGFGIPLIESMALGIPVICADVPVFHEVSGEMATFFDPHSPSDIAEKLSGTLKNPIIPPKKKVQKHLEQFYWDNIYKKFAADLRDYATRT